MADNLLAPRIDGQMQATKPKNALMGLLSEALMAADEYAQRPDRSMPMGKANPVLSLLSNALAVGDIGKTMDRYNYGHDLTRGTGMATQMLPETANALATVGPAVAKWPKQAAVAMGLLSGDASAATKAATVWHGSPHKFDRFDASKIGTGEGAQAYGHGLYLAESPDVAKDYAGALAAAKANKPVGRVDLADAYQNLAGDVPDTLIGARRDFRELQDMGALTPADRRDFLQAVQSNIDASRGGSLYKVDLPDSAISRMLDWDKPLSQQAPDVRAAVEPFIEPMRKIEAGTSGAEWGDLAKSRTYDPTWQEILLLLRKNNIDRMTAQDFLTGGRGPEVSEAARKLGIPGIRYLDGGSRGAGTGTSNFVVFPGEEGLLSILERNGVPLK